MVGVGLYFANKDTDTDADDYFRGGKQMLWWAAGCSIFVTMLSSITYMAIPAKAYAQDQVYLRMNITIALVAPITVFLALPFFRHIDATSAYEYLEKRSIGFTVCVSVGYLTSPILPAPKQNLAGLTLYTQG